MLTWSCSCFLVGILATVFMRCDGARRPTKVIYDSVTPHTSLTGASVQRGGGYYQQLYIDDTPRLIVGETNYVRMYSISDVSSEQDSFQLPLIPKPALIGLPCESERQEPEIDCQNYINVIYRAVANSKWYYCGTNGNYPQCWVCASAKCTDSEIINEVDAKHYVRDVFQYNQPFYIDSDSQVFGTGAEIGLARGIVNGDGTFGSFEITTKSSNLNLINLGSDVDYLGDLIEFMNSDGDTHIYFFYREEATEYVSGSSAFYSRVGRVCKDDAGGNAGSTLVGAFTTFLKARLNCSVTGGDFPYNYDYLRDIYRSPRNPKILYAAFTDDTAGQVNSAVCVYNLDEIAAVFKESNVKGQESISSLWLPYGGTALNPRPGTCAVAFDESVYPVLRAYALTDQSISNLQTYNPPGTAGAFDRDSDPPVMVLDGLYVTQLVVHEDAVNSNDIFFLGTADGKVYKAYVEGSGLSAQTRLVEAIDLSDSSTSAACADGNYLDCDEAVLSMIIHSASNTVFVGTQSSLHELPVQHCADYTIYKDCIIVQDPYCIWTGGVSDGSCVTGSAASGDQCLDPDPFSCNPTNFQMPSPFEPTGCDLSNEPTYVRGLINGVNENIVQVNMWAQAAQGSVWGETTYSCSCGCLPMEITETTAQSTNDNMEYLLGSYLFDMSSCTTDADVTITLKANGNTMPKTVSVQMDSSAAVETDTAKLEMVSQVDAQIHAYYYQACWWQKNMAMPRNAEDVYCYDCNT